MLHYWKIQNTQFVENYFLCLNRDVDIDNIPQQNCNLYYNTAVASLIFQTKHSGKGIFPYKTLFLVFS